MVVVLLNTLAACHPYVELFNLLVAHARQELVRLRRVESYDVRRRAGAEPGRAHSSLRVPQLHLTVVGAGEEGDPRWVEVDVGDRLGVARVCSEELSRVMCVP